MVTVFGLTESAAAQHVSSSSSSSSWQDRLLEASHLAVMNAMPLHQSNDAIELFGAIDNTSTSAQCVDDGFCVPCPDDRPLWWLVLRWLKMMLYKVARSYTGKPLLLMILPLTVGLLVGYLIGTRTTRTTSLSLSSSSSRKQQKQEQQHTGTTITTLTRIPFIETVFMCLRDWIAVPCLAFFLGDRPYHTENEENVHTAVVDKNIETTISPVPAATSLDEEETAAVMEERLRKEDPNLLSREEAVRTDLKSDMGTHCESGVDASLVPRHVAVIMDGNRRYGKEKYGNATRGHWDGSSKLVDFAKWCIAEQISVLTVYAFSTENWNRPPDEVAALMSIFVRYCDELRVEALKRNIKILVLSTDSARIPSHVQKGITQMVEETKHCDGLTMNICISYGSRGEIVEASRSVVAGVLRGELDVSRIDENEFQKRLLTSHCGDPDVLIRTSGEIRISNFMLWQLAYTEMFFVEKPWPAIEKKDLLSVIRTFAQGRQRRFGK